MCCGIVGRTTTTKKCKQNQNHWKTLYDIQKTFNNKFGLKTLMSGLKLMQIKELMYKSLKNHDFNRSVQKKFLLKANIILLCNTNKNYAILGELTCCSQQAFLYHSLLPLSERCSTSFNSRAEWWQAIIVILFQHHIFKRIGHLW